MSDSNHRTADDLPFNLRALRTIEYDASNESLRELRKELTRAVRILLLANRSTG